MEKNAINRIHNELSVSAQGLASSRGSSSSDGHGGASRASPQGKLNGGAPVSAAVKAQSADEDSTASE